jgi:hypothetical protein
MYRLILNYCRGFRGLYFSNRKYKVKLITEYENATEKVLLPMESILYNAIQLQQAHLYFVVSGLKIIGPGNPDSNLESRFISMHVCRPV